MISQFLSTTTLATAGRVLAIVVPLALAGTLGYRLGSSQTAKNYTAQLAEQTAHYDRERQAVADARATELGAALTEQQRLNDQAHQVGYALIEARAELANARSQLTRRIDNATRSDGDRFTGLGPDSLRVYRAALGYPERDPDLPATDAGHTAQAGSATGPDAGLSPGDLIAHAADYGQWCQQLDVQLTAVARLFPVSQGDTHE
ncbi:hypothetical protein [Microvirgula aerodenitrificans]|uniref:hypothetical protein n=1 Tax=Microvirgula aerodenitrificans TaxID=57480 RepID=UPI0006878A66|nr:hypothetical protein [Microvirgula aerodenitrificans]